MHCGDKNYTWTVIKYEVNDMRLLLVNRFKYYFKDKPIGRHEILKDEDALVWRLKNGHLHREDGPAIQYFFPFAHKHQNRYFLNNIEMDVDIWKRAIKLGHFLKEKI